MEHLDERRMIEDLWDGAALTVSERAHLSLCADCQRNVVILTRMRDELQVARQSQLSSEAEDNLFSIFAQSVYGAKQGNPHPSALGSFVEWINALPLWDSRQQMSATRNVNKSSYRLLFGADETEIELMVERKHGRLRLMGEVMSGDADAKSGLALVELMQEFDIKTARETECDANGRFLLEGIAPGSYVMTITPRYSQLVVMVPLELT